MKDIRIFFDATPLDAAFLRSKGITDVKEKDYMGHLDIICWLGPVVNIGQGQAWAGGNPLCYVSTRGDFLRLCFGLKIGPYSGS